MILLKETIKPVVQNWALGRQPAWAFADFDAIIAAITKVSTATTPHLVNDVMLDDDHVQLFLLARVISAIDDCLVRTAAGARKALKLAPLVHTSSGAVALGLRSATNLELVDLPGVGKRRAVGIARLLALRRDILSIDELESLNDIGSSTISKLKENTYLDQPKAGLVSASLLAFCSNPTISNYLALLDRTDLEILFGDGNTLARHSPLGGTTVERFLRLLYASQVDAQRRLSPASGALASHVKRYLTRHLLCQSYIGGMTLTDGVIVVNDTYLSAMLDLIASANETLRFAVFVATATPGEQPGGGSQAIIEALEARAAAGIAVQVILDRDKPGEAYLSRAINRPIIERLRAAQIAVKQDAPVTLLHSKFLVADRSSVIVGSHNLTNSSIWSTHELSVRLDSAPLAEAFADRFDALWNTLP